MDKVKCRDVLGIRKSSKSTEQIVHTRIAVVTNITMCINSINDGEVIEMEG